VRRLAAADLLTTTGSGVAGTALSFHIYVQTHSAYWLAATLLLTFGITGVFAPAAGLIVDRFDRKTVMIVANLLGAACWASLIMTQSSGVLIGVAAAAAIVSLPSGIAATAMVPNLVPADRLTAATSLISSAANAGQIAGPVLGGMIYVAGGALIASTLRVTRAGQADADAGGMLAGFRLILADPVLRRLSAWWMLGYLSLNIALVADLPITRIFHAGPVGYGLINATFGAGLLAGSLLARQIRTGREWRWVRLGALGVAAGWAIIAVTPWFGLVLVGSAVAAVLDSIGGTAGYVIYQRRSDDARRGRLFAAVHTLGLVANVLGFGAAGFIASQFGAQTVYAVGALLAVAGVIVLRWPTARTAPAAPAGPALARPGPAARSDDGA
jgi:MFS family permease